MALAEKIKFLRTKAGKSLQQVADGIGVSKAHVWELERGSSTNPGLEILRKLSEYFKVSVAYLADDTIPPEDSAPLQFFREFENLTDKDWETLRTVAERLKGD